MTAEEIHQRFGRIFGEMIERKRDKKVLACWDACEGIMDPKENFKAFKKAWDNYKED